MTNIREILKRLIPPAARDAIIAARAKLSAPPLELTALHDYEIIKDPAPQGRLTLVMPSLASKTIFGGVSTGVDILFACAQALNMPVRVVIDDFGDPTDFSYIERAAERVAFVRGDIEFLSRTAETQPISVRASDIFIAFNWWVALNLRGLLAQQMILSGAKKPRTLLYIVQDYEPGFYPWNSTHMVARAAFDSDGRTFGIFNSHELHEYFRAQGHAYEREFVIPLKMSKSLKNARNVAEGPKEKTMLVYGRPSVARNCFPAVVAGLKAFVRLYPEYRDWRLESAGGDHDAIDLGYGKVLSPLGKLSIEKYVGKLETAGVGLSLMASPHPSYPPLEMAHFGVRTVTNGYACKDLSGAHENIVSIKDVLPETIAAALARQCGAVLADRQGGWRSKSMLPNYLSDDGYPFMNDLVEALRQDAP